MVLNPKPFSLIPHKYAFKGTDKFMQIQPRRMVPTELNSSETPPKHLPNTPCSPARSAPAAGPPPNRAQHTPRTLRWVLLGITVPSKTSQPTPTGPSPPVQWVLPFRTEFWFRLYLLFAMGWQGSLRMQKLAGVPGSATGLVLIEWGDISAPPCHTRTHQRPFLESALT